MSPLPSIGQQGHIMVDGLDDSCEVESREVESSGTRQLRAWCRTRCGASARGWQCKGNSSRRSMSSSLPANASREMSRRALLPRRAAAALLPLPTFRSRPALRSAPRRTLVSAAHLQFGQPLHETHPHLIQAGERMHAVCSLCPACTDPLQSLRVSLPSNTTIAALPLPTSCLEAASPSLLPAISSTAPAPSSIPSTKTPTSSTSPVSPPNTATSLHTKPADPSDAQASTSPMRSL